MTDNSELARKIVEIFSTGDVALVDDLFASNYVDHQGLSGNALVGPDGFASVVAVARAPYTWLEVSVEDLIAERDRVVVRLRWKGVPKQPERIIVAAERETIEILRFAEGRVVEHWGARVSHPRVD